MKGQRGITLVALVITVIVMLILAGVAISVLASDTGLFAKTKSSVNEYNDSVTEENARMDNLVQQMNHYVDQLTSAPE